MTQEMRQEIVKLARELPDGMLAEALVFLHSLTQKAQKNNPDNSATIEQSEFEKAMQIYKQGSEKYKNALRELS